MSSNVNAMQNFSFTRKQGWVPLSHGFQRLSCRSESLKLFTFDDFWKAIGKALLASPFLHSAPTILNQNYNNIKDYNLFSIITNFLFTYSEVLVNFRAV